MIKSGYSQCFVNLQISIKKNKIFPAFAFIKTISINDTPFKPDTDAFSNLTSANKSIKLSINSPSKRKKETKCNLSSV